MNKSLFREKSLKKLSSPEDLNSYMTVASPPVWAAVCAVVILVIGAVIWCIVGRMDSTIPALVVSRDGECVCYISEGDYAAASEGMSLKAGGEELTLGTGDGTPLSAEETLSDYAMHLGGFEQGEYVYAFAVDGDIPDGNYEAQIVIEAVSAISFLWN